MFFRKNIISIIGRPNVGKSSLFNRLIRKRSAIVGAEPGITRDRSYGTTEWNGVSLTFVDTGGLLPCSKKEMQLAIQKQVDAAISESFMVLFLVDASCGIQYPEREIAKKIGHNRYNVILVLNKIDLCKETSVLAEFNALGLTKQARISALQGTGSGDLLDMISDEVKDLPDTNLPVDENDVIKMAIIGRPNVGKSSLLNSLCREERVIVHREPGTTRDAVDTYIKYKDRAFKLIDTAGLRKRARIGRQEIEFYADIRALDAIQRTHVSVLVLDTIRGFERQDICILSKAAQAGNGLILVFNKWDIVPKQQDTFDTVVKNFNEKLPEYDHIPKLAVSALTGLRVNKVLDMGIEIRKNMCLSFDQERVSCWSRKIFNAKPHPVSSGRSIRLHGMRQISVDPPVFHVYVNYPQNVMDSYKRFLSRQVIKEFKFHGCSIKIEYVGIGSNLKLKKAV